MGDKVSERIVVHTDLEVYRKAIDAAMCILELSKTFPREETYSLTDQIRRSSRSVCTNLSEVRWKRRYEKAFTNELCDAEGECAEMQTWLEFTTKCGYIDADQARKLYRIYNAVLATWVGMIIHPETSTIQQRP